MATAKRKKKPSGLPGLPPVPVIVGDVAAVDSSTANKDAAAARVTLAGINKEVDARFLFIERAVFGWFDNSDQTRHRGLLERLDGMHFSIRIGLGLAAVVLLKSFGVPTDKLFSIVTQLISHAIGY